MNLYLGRKQHSVVKRSEYFADLTTLRMCAYGEFGIKVSTRKNQNSKIGRKEFLEFAEAEAKKYQMVCQLRWYQEGRVKKKWILEITELYAERR